MKLGPNFYLYIDFHLKLFLGYIVMKFFGVSFVAFI
jgi:hypothetical protein